MICDTCGKETSRVSRVVIDKGYNRANARPVYNCPECFERKNHERVAMLASEEDSPKTAAQREG
jgi:uncharacterized Zn finger protein